jgi:lipid A disaccharide synthetase
VTTTPTPVDHLAEARRLLTLVRPTALTNEEMLEFLAYDKSAATVIAAANAHTRIALVDAVLATTGTAAAEKAATGEALIA